MTDSPEPSALRVVHLLGGAQAVDFEEDNVDIGLDGLKPFLTPHRRQSHARAAEAVSS